MWKKIFLSVRTCLLMYQSKPENMKALNLKKHKNECSKIYLPVSSFVYFKIYLPVSSIVNFKIYLPASGIVYFKIFLSVSSIVDSDIYLLASNMNECSKIYLPASSIVYFKIYLPVLRIFDLKFTCLHQIWINATKYTCLLDLSLRMPVCWHISYTKLYCNFGLTWINSVSSSLITFVGTCLP